jgi:hypothetical protein
VNEFPPAGPNYFKEPATKVTARLNNVAGAQQGLRFFHAYPHEQDWSYILKVAYVQEQRSLEFHAAR